jgi:hypothetical protein
MKVAVFIIAIALALVRLPAGAYQLLGPRLDHTCITHSGELDAYLAAAVVEWGAYSAVTDCGPGADLTVSYAADGLIQGAYGMAHPLQADGWQAALWPSTPIHSCVINIYRDGFMASSEADRQRLITHEVGHCFGLAHSDVPGALMDARAATGVPHPAFSCDDAAAIAALYPRPGVPVCVAATPVPVPMPSATPAPSPVATATVPRLTRRAFVAL